jgi:hypothetical protein
MQNRRSRRPWEVAWEIVGSAPGDPLRDKFLASGE